MGFFTAAPPPPTPLGRYRALSKHASIHVSPLVLGAQSIGDAWAGIGFGAMDKASSFKLLDAFFEAGGNFIDTANQYQNESSEKFIGEWMEERGIRDQMVIATKYSFNYTLANPAIKTKINYHGNNHKSMLLSLEASLKKLRTSYIDVFYVHVWDYETSIKEVMDNLHSLVVSGKVLYLGISDTPAWVVSQCNQYAMDHGKTPFAVYQGSWNVMDRSFERDILPMAREHGMALCAWNVLASGKLRSDAEEERREKSGEMGRDLKINNNGWKRTPQEKKTTDALEKVAKEVGVESLTAVAIAYLLHKAPYVFPIIGGRKVEHMQQNIQALSISLSGAQIEYLESVNPIDLGFPHTIVGDGSQPNGMFAMVAQTDRVPFQAPITPA
ncbi:NADP-dependent oxidoreductase domain-containing protein [Mycena vitilis]|nr:NADP-dependent oxidoreductase domain-containing protein [Mycena vitilis]